MRFLGAAVKEVIGLFISDWLQTAVVIVILIAGWFSFTRFGAPALAVLVLLLAAQLVWFANAAARRSRQPSPS